MLDDLDYDGSSRKSKTTKREESEPLPADPYWSPTTYSTFKLLMSARFAAALWTTIYDCDETFNYWEPVSFSTFTLIAPLKNDCSITVILY